MELKQNRRAYYENLRDQMIREKVAERSKNKENQTEDDSSEDEGCLSAEGKR
jgi:hypothetical protein